VPDLFVWNVLDGICKFVEVKGPGDSLSENQKVAFRVSCSLTHL
jgi:Fanconi-associated nuclease 1